MIPPLIPACCLLCFLCLCLHKQSAKSLVLSQGRIFGTNYIVKLGLPQTAPVRFSHTASRNQQNKQELRSLIAKKLREIDRSMSLWKEDSELALLNAHPAGKAFFLSENLLAVLKKAKKIYKLTHGAFDPGQGRLFALWGVGPSKHAIDSMRQAPQAGLIGKILLEDSMAALSIVSKKGYVTKKHAKLYLNLNAIAKGYAVDQIALLLQRRGISSYMVEIGGEVRVGKRKNKRELWQIGIEKPRYDTGRSLLRVVYLEKASIASSGDYRNYFRSSSGELYSHILDPRKGYPKKSSIKAVSVIGPECMLADALATALLVMSLKQGKELIAKLPNYEALWVLLAAQEQKKSYVVESSEHMERYLHDPFP